MVGNGGSASSQHAIDFLNTQSFRQLFLRYFYFATPGVHHRVQNFNAGPQLYSTYVEGNVAAVKVQLICWYEIAQKAYLLILIRRMNLSQNK